MPKALVVDDDRAVRLQLKHSLEQIDYFVEEAEEGQTVVDTLKQFEPDVILLDISLPNCSGLDVFQWIRAVDRKTPIIFVTAESDSSIAIQAIQMGAYDYIVKPIDLQHLQELVEEAVESKRLMDTPVAIGASDDYDAAGDVFIGKSAEMLEVFKQIGRVARQDVNVLIRGESGTGKELVARSLYQHGNRSGECFLAVNCAALPDQLLESELFGHEKGAFTGATQRRIGRFEQCDGGTIFLDEIGDMSPLVQGKVLRLLQEQRFERVGGSETIQTDVRIIAATHQNLEQMVQKGKFRSDLYYRLNGVTIALTPLRERPEDLEPLITYFFSRQRHKHGKKEITGISPGVVRILKDYHWPGNIRELESVLRQGLINATGTVITPDCLPEDVFTDLETSSEFEGEAGYEAGYEVSYEVSGLEQFIDSRLESGSENLYQESLEFMEKVLLRKVLEETQGNQSKASEILGITRGKIRNRISRFGISFQKTFTADNNS